MGVTRLKLARGVGGFVPVTVNFSALTPNEDQDQDSFAPDDGGLETRRLQTTLEYEELIVQILYNLDPREKLVFIFQLLRDGGYQIDHSAFAKTIRLSRRQYMRILDEVRMKSALFAVGYHNSHNSQKSGVTNTANKT